MACTGAGRERVQTLPQELREGAGDQQRSGPVEQLKGGIGVSRFSSISLRCSPSWGHCLSLGLPRLSPAVTRSGWLWKRWSGYLSWVCGVLSLCDRQSKHLRVTRHDQRVSVSEVTLTSLGLALQGWEEQNPRERAKQKHRVLSRARKRSVRHKCAVRDQITPYLISVMRYLEIYKRQQETAPKTAWVPPASQELAESLSQTWVIIFGNKN